MSEMLARTPDQARPAEVAPPSRPLPEAGAAARGIMLALAASSLAWIGLALLVPRLW